MSQRVSAQVVVIASVLWEIVASPLLIETDAYRYATILLAAIALFFYYRSPAPPKTDWLGWLCLGWSGYALARFLVIYLASPDHQRGSSEWLYFFPVFFPILGVSLGLCFRHLRTMVAVFFTVAMIALVATAPYAAILSGTRGMPLIMHNSIHGAVACGMLLIGALFWLFHNLTSEDASSSIARLSKVVAPLVMAMSLVCIYGAQSKGVWLALLLTSPVVVFFLIGKLQKQFAVAAAFAVIIVAGGIYATRSHLYSVAGPTVSATAVIADGVQEGGSLGQLVVRAINSPNTPEAMRERLMLWANAWEVFQTAPIFGSGNEWLTKWHHTAYASVPFTLLHNGYLEILVRHGLFGVLVFAVMLGAFLTAVWRASRAGIVAPTVFSAYATLIFFFAMTLLSNSNNRLAIGEALALSASAFGFYCHMRLKQPERLEMTVG
ncbi:O-antigen ligase family protein [Rhizobium sp. BK251]|uniref:O-antigen ligase family protein n=1 Tax=Rhizobium sp. BK251 TaxID=2512125 RepID=UPI00104FB4D5|nr:O-antigen ligase family protein [Rhizobium sp. BK251]TCL72733.1 O-antigen ligase [Rhizobium sp. BK251]